MVGSLLQLLRHRYIQILLMIVGGIAKKPGVVKERIEIREYLDLTISIDHDVVDGAPMVRFVNRFRELFESGYGLNTN